MGLVGWRSMQPGCAWPPCPPPARCAGVTQCTTPMQVILGDWCRCLGLCDMLCGQSEQGMVLASKGVSMRRCAQVLFTEGLWVPLVNVQNVYVLPGIPRLFKQMLGAHQERFNGPPFLSAVLYTNVPEGDLAGTPLFMSSSTDGSEHRIVQSSQAPQGCFPSD